MIGSRITAGQRIGDPHKITPAATSKQRNKTNSDNEQGVRESKAHVTREEAPERLTKGLARHPVPIMLLARLAVDHRWQGKGVGKAY
jgi:GNAT superfamily N-acetyltransferase